MSTIRPITAFPSLAGANVAADDRILEVLDASTGRKVHVKVSDLVSAIFALATAQSPTFAGLTLTGNLVASGLPTVSQGDGETIWNNLGVLTVSDVA